MQTQVYINLYIFKFPVDIRTSSGKCKDSLTTSEFMSIKNENEKLVVFYLIMTGGSHLNLFIKSDQNQNIIYNTETILLSQGHGETVDSDRSSYWPGPVGSILGRNLLSQMSLHLTYFITGFL